jgi:hypothetical protein
MSVNLSAGVSGSFLVRPNVSDQAVDQIFRETDLINVLFSVGQVEESAGSQPFIWNIIKEANATAGVFTEGAALSTFGNQLYEQASLPAFYVRAAGGETGHVRDNRVKNGLYQDIRALEIQKATEDCWKAFEDQLCGSTANRGLASIVDAADTYAGLNPATVTQWASLETAVGGALAVTTLQDMYETLVGSTYGASPTHILAPQNQVTNYVNVAGVPGAANSAYRAMLGGAFDAGVIHPLVTFNGLPVVPVRGLTSTELYMGDISKLKLIMHRMPTVTDIAKTNDDETFMVSLAGALRLERRRSFGKLTGVTA